MNLTPVLELLSRVMGLDIASIGEGAIAQALKRRMFATGCTSFEDYVARLPVSKEELQELIEEVTVPETWFFREEAAFESLRIHARQELLSTGRLRPFTVACLPCATGEEAYSIVMALMDVGVDHSKFRVQALDISYRALILAQKAVYGDYSFRAADKSFRGRYFEPNADGYQVVPAVRRQVSFYHGNLLALTNPFDSANYDAVFCRNLLIYLDSEARKQVMDSIKKILAPTGILLVGQSEVSIAIKEGFVRSEDGALRFGNAAALPEQQKFNRKQTERRQFNDENRVKEQRRMPFATVRDFPPIVKKEAADAAMTETGAIRAMADSGRLEEARACCDARIRGGEHTSELYGLLGLILNAQGNSPSAREYFRKAVYLDPQYAEARQQLVMIEQRSGLERRKAESRNASVSTRRENRRV